MKTINAIVLINLILLSACNQQKNEQKSENEVQKTEVDLCKCLSEPGTSKYMQENGKACDEAISKAIDVEDWSKVNMKYDKVSAKKFDALVYQCTGKRTTVNIAGTYSGTDNIGMESTIILNENGRLVIQSSISDGELDYGWWIGEADNLSLYHKDFNGNDELIGHAKVSEEGLTIIGGQFYQRQLL